MRKLFILAAALAVAACSKTAAPVIGISTGYAPGKISVNESYVKSVVNAGGIPYIVPLIRDSILAETIIRSLDGIIFTGGEDFDPAYYGEEPAENLGKVNAPRDTSDLMLMRMAMRHGLAVLGICRGEQGLNVALGGSLYQDLPSQHPSSADSTQLMHRQEEPSTVPTQTVGIVVGTHLYSLIGCDTLLVNSHHHEAVKVPAAGLTVTATASDGVVEAFEDLSRNVVAVQFHPEAFAQSGQYPYLRIFEDLVDRARN